MVKNSKAKKSAIKTFKRASKKTSKKSLTSQIQKTVSRLILKKAESKEKTTDFDLTQLYHNVGYYKKINDTTDMPVQGLTDESRIGDSINVGGFYLRILCGQKNDRPNCTWKFYIFKVPKGATVNYNTFFNSYTNNILLDNPNKDLVTTLKSLTIKKNFPNAYERGTGQYASREITFPVTIWLPYKKVYKFQTNNSTTHDDDDIYLVAFAYDAYGTLLTDNIGYIEWVSTMYYKDP